MNPLFLEDGLHTHRERLQHEAAANRLLRDARPAALAPHDMLLARLGDLLLAGGFFLKRRSKPAGALVPDVNAQSAAVMSVRIGDRLWRQSMGARPAFGFHLLRYDDLPTIGLMYWRLDRFGAHGASSGDYAAITWLAAGTPRAQV